jgi:hypothetical protein
MANVTSSYGSVEFYAGEFSDLIADVGDGPLMDNLVAGFFQAIDEWENYHTEAAKRYGSFRERIRKA